MLLTDAAGKMIKDEEMKTGKAIIDNWRVQPGGVNVGLHFYDLGIEELEKRIDAALRETRAEGEIVGWEKAFKMVKASFGNKK